MTDRELMQQKPVAWMHKETGLLRREISRPKGADWDSNYWEPLYASPAPPQRPWVGLTKEEAKEISLANRPYVIDMVAALEARLKEKNT